MKRTKLTASVRVAGYLLLLTAPLWGDGLFFANGTPPFWDFLAIPALVLLATLVILALTRVRPYLRLVLMVALLERLAATGAFLYLTYRVYYAADTISYIRGARLLAHDFYATGHLRLLHPVWSNNFVIMLASDLFVLLWPSAVLGTFVFSLLALVGQYLAYRAYTIAFPAANRTVAAVALLLMPSLVFWSAALGKDSLTLLFLGLVLYSTARLERGFEIGSLTGLLAGLAGTFLVRPHVGAMVLLALLVPYTILRPGRGFSGVAVKFVMVPLLFVATLYLTLNAAVFVKLQGVEQVAPMLHQMTRLNQLGAGSAFGPASLPLRLLQAPLLFFRPLPWEVNSPQSAIAGAEALFLLCLCWRLRRRLWQLLFHQRLSLFAWFVVAFLGEFYLVFSAAMSNFGLLARERVMGLPFLLILFCLAAELPEPARRRRISRQPLYRAAAPPPADATAQWGQRQPKVPAVSNA